jgi:hypothetical protein
MNGLLMWAVWRVELKVAGPPCRTALIGARGLRPRGRPIEQEVPTVNDGMSSVARNAVGVISPRLAGAIIAGFDVHLREITFDCLDAASGEVCRGRIGSSPSAVEEWVGQF